MLTSTTEDVGVVASLLKLDTPIFDHELDGFFLPHPEILTLLVDWCMASPAEKLNFCSYGPKYHLKVTYNSIYGMTPPFTTMRIAGF
jgi:hypothetical protein